MSTEEKKLVIIERKYKDQDGRKHLNEYKVLKPYGEGSVGRVFEIENTVTDKHYAMKIVNKLLLQMRKEYIRLKKGKMGVKTAFDAVEKEINIIRGLDHDNIVKLHEILTDEDNEKLYLILDNCEKGELMKWNEDKAEFTPCTNEKYFSEEEIRSIMVDAINGLMYLHNQGIVHRDIKPQNLMMCLNGKTKIGDFGSAQRVESKENDTLSNTQGTSLFMPPECWSYDITDFSGRKVDIWALGVTLYALAYNKIPFWADNDIDLSNMILMNELDFSHEREVSSELKQLIKKMLTKNPDERPELSELLHTDFFLKNQA